MFSTVVKDDVSFVLAAACDQLGMRSSGQEFLCLRVEQLDLCICESLADIQNAPFESDVISFLATRSDESIKALSVNR